MDNINDLKSLFPIKSGLLSNIEELIEKEIGNNKNYKGFLKLMDSFFYLFSDDIYQSLDKNRIIDQRILLYSEAFKRIRSSYLIATNGYFVDAISLLRAVFELNKGINAIQNQVITVSEYFGKKRDSSFDSLSDKEKEKLIQEHIKYIDNLVNAYDDKGLPSNLKDSLRTFKSNLHISVHKAFGNIVLNYKPFVSEGKGNLFRPESNIVFFDLYLNNSLFVILMYLKNMIKSGFLSKTNEDKITQLSNFLENSYLAMDVQYHHDIVQYIKIKYC